MDGKLSFQLPDFGGRIRKVVVVADSFTQSAKCDDSLTAAALLRTCPDGEQSFTELKPGPQGPACRWWSGSLALLMPTVHYRFLIFSKDGAFWFNGTGLHHHTPTDADDFRVLAGYNAPRWVRDTVFYQIFPDRFCDGDPASNVKDGAFSNRGNRPNRAPGARPRPPRDRRQWSSFMVAIWPGSSSAWIISTTWA
jgi:hypothetical protein